MDKNEKNEKESSRDFGVITSILNEMGINDYEPKVVNQLLEFTYRYVTTVLGKFNELN